MIHIIAINFFSSRYAQSLLASLQAQTVAEWRLTIVDNSEDENEYSSLVKICHRDSRAEAISTGANLGYLGGFDFGVRMLGKELPEWVCMSNMDVMFDSEFCGALGDSAPIGLGAVAPRITNKGREGNPYILRRPSASWAAKRMLIFNSIAISRMYVYLSSLVRRLRARFRRPHSARLMEALDIYAPHGSVVIFAKRYITGGGRTTQPTLLFGEEFTIAESCRDLDLRVRFIPTVVAKHVGSVSTGTFRSAWMLALQRDSTRYIHELLRQH